VNVTIGADAVRRPRLGFQINNQTKKENEDPKLFGENVDQDSLLWNQEARTHLNVATQSDDSELS
jgi:hypothetical protein